MNKPAVEMVATDKLIPYARNAKKHDEAQVSLIAGSIRQFGFNNPVLIAEDNGIVAGHGRVLAAMKLGMAEVPCIRLSHLDENQRRAYILADNRLAELGGGWDLDMLASEMAEIDRESMPEFDISGLDFDEMLGEFSVSEADAPDLQGGDRNPFRQITFTVHDEQFEEIMAAIGKAKSEGYGVSVVNENSNANAIAAVCARFNRG